MLDLERFFCKKNENLQEDTFPGQRLAIRLPPVTTTAIKTSFIYDTHDF